MTTKRKPAQRQASVYVDPPPHVPAKPESILERISAKWLIIGVGAIFVIFNDGAQVWDRITNWQSTPAKAVAEKAAADLKTHQIDDDKRLVDIQKSLAMSAYNADVGRAWVYSGLANVGSSVAQLAVQVCRSDPKKQMDCKPLEDNAAGARQDVIEAKKQAQETTAKKP